MPYGEPGRASVGSAAWNQPYGSSEDDSLTPGRSRRCGRPWSCRRGRRNRHHARPVGTRQRFQRGPHRNGSSPPEGRACGTSVWCGLGDEPGERSSQLAVRARELWEEIAGRLSALPFAPPVLSPSAVSEVELAVMKEAFGGTTPAVRQWELLDGPEAREANPELSAEVLGALYCGADAIVEPRGRQSIREHIWRAAGLQLFARPFCGRAGRRGGTGRRWCLAPRGQGVRLHRCPAPGLIEQYVERPPTRRVRLQMLETAPYPGRLTTALADGDSMRYYPAFDLPGPVGC